MHWFLEVAATDFCKQLVYLVDLSLSQPGEVGTHFFAQKSVQLDYAALSWLSDVLKCVGQASSAEI